MPPGDNQSIAIDVPIFLHRFYYATGPFGLIHSFQLLRESLRRYGYRPVWVFDGKKLPLKDKERERRRERAPVVDFTIEGTNHPTREMVAQIQTFLQDDEIFVAEYEAEALCAYFVHTGICYAALTHDTDSFAYLCPRTILNVSMNLDQGKLVVMDEVLRDLDMTRDQFQTFCVLCGNDFCDNERNVGPVRAFERAKASSHLPDSAVLRLFQQFCYQDKACNAEDPPEEDLCQEESCPMEFQN